MAIKIRIDETYPPFAALPVEHLKKVAVGIGATGMNTMFFSYDMQQANLANSCDSGINQGALMVSFRRPLTFSREAFAVFGNVTATDYSSSRLGTLLSDYVKRGVLVVEDAGAPMTPAQILTFVP
jgi:hypothetical protein